MDRSWKAAERRTARRLGGQRIPVTGERAGADVKAGHLRVQHKLGRRQPAYLKDWLDGICGSALAESQRTGEQLLPLVIWKPLYVADDEAVVMMKFSDFCRWYGRGE